MKAFIWRVMVLVILFAFIANTAVKSQQKASNSATLKTSGYAPVNGLKIYYEIHGEGKPLVLLHGSYMSIDLNYGQLIPILAKSYKVIAFEMQGHGRTADIDRPFSFDALADDVDGLLKYLHVDSAIVLGYSLGATVALNTAIKYPSLVTKLIFISSAYKSEGWTQAARDLFPSIKPEFFEHTPLKTEYDRLAPDKTHWNAFVTKLVKFDATPFDLGADKVKTVKCPVLMVYGDNDGVDLKHVAELYGFFGGGVLGDMTGLPKSQLAIVPASTHVTLMMQTDKIAALVNSFLGGK